MDRQRRPPRLTERVEKFIAAYVGEARQNATEAARLAGYKAARTVGWQLVRKFREAIAEEQLRVKKAAVMGPEEAQRLLSDIARGTCEANPVKLRAVETALKMHGLLNDRLNISYDRSELSKQLDSALAALAQARRLPPDLDSKQLPGHSTVPGS